MEIISLSINLEHIGDIIDKNLMELANKKIKRQLQFSREGAADLEEFHRIVIDNFKLGVQHFFVWRREVGSANVWTRKQKFARSEMAAAESHMARLREGRLESMETSSPPPRYPARPETHPFTHMRNSIPGA